VITNLSGHVIASPSDYHLFREILVATHLSKKGQVGEGYDSVADDTRLGPLKPFQILAGNEPSPMSCLHIIKHNLDNLQD
jgi:hypothetical protein